jgi:hypothetical protein
VRTGCIYSGHNQNLTYQSTDNTWSGEYDSERDEVMGISAKARTRHHSLANKKEEEEKSTDFDIETKQNLV